MAVGPPGSWHDLQPIQTDVARLSGDSAYELTEWASLATKRQRPPPPTLSQLIRQKSAINGKRDTVDH